MSQLSEQVWTVFGRVMTAAAFIMVIAVLAGCQHQEPRVITQVLVQKIEVPRSLLTCLSEPVYGTVSVSVKDLMKFASQLGVPVPTAATSWMRCRASWKRNKQNPGF